MSGEVVEPWYVTHVRENRGHRTEATLGEPARCLVCGAQDASAGLVIDPRVPSTSEGEGA